MKAGVQKPVQPKSHHNITDLLETWTLSVDLVCFHTNTNDELQASNLTICISGGTDLSLFYGYSHPSF